MIVEVEKLRYVAVENEATKSIELFEPNASSRVLEITERGPQGQKGDKGDKGEDVEIYSDGTFIALASKVNFSQSIAASLQGDTIEVTAYAQTSATFVLTAEQIADGEVVLPKTPLYPNLVRLYPEGGVEQFNGIDFSVTDNVISWRNLGLDGFLEIGERILVNF